MRSKYANVNNKENNKLKVYKDASTNTMAILPVPLQQQQLKKQRTIESWYSPQHFLIILPERLVLSILLEYLVAKDMHSLFLTSFVKQFAILHGGNDVNAYVKKLVRCMKEINIYNLLQTYHHPNREYTLMCMACEIPGDMAFFRKFVSCK